MRGRGGGEEEDEIYLKKMYIEEKGPLSFARACLRVNILRELVYD